MAPTFFSGEIKMGQCLSATKPLIAAEVRNVIIPELVEHVLPRLEDIINQKIEDALAVSAEKAS